MRSFILSLTLHLLVLGIAFFSGGSLSLPKAGQGQAQTAQNQPGQAQTKIEIEEIVPRPKDDPEQAAREEKATKDGILAQAHNNQKCKEFFGGIGVTTGSAVYTYNGNTEIRHYITEIAPDYPAERVGLKELDQVITPVKSIRGEIGTTIQIDVMRSGQMLTFSLVREKICVEKRPKSSSNP